LRLVATGALTINLVHVANGKTVNLPKTMNSATGKESTYQTAFWNKATRNYAKSWRSLSTDVIIKEAKGFVGPVYGCNTTQTESIDVDKDDERACLIDNSADEIYQSGLY
jgi:hypothetical protein